MAIHALRRRQLLLAGGALAAGSLALVSFWPSHAPRAQVGYPFARRVLGRVDPLWSVPVDVLAQATTEDAARLTRLSKGREREQRAVVASAEALATTCERPKWDIVQP